MLTVNTPNKEGIFLEAKSVGITVKNTGALEDLINILMSNGYWIRVEPKGENVMLWIKEDNE